MLPNMVTNSTTLLNFTWPVTSDLCAVHRTMWHHSVHMFLKHMAKLDNVSLIQSCCFGQVRRGSYDWWKKQIHMWQDWISTCLLERKPGIFSHYTSVDRFSDPFTIYWLIERMYTVGVRQWSKVKRHTIFLPTSGTDSPSIYQSMSHLACQWSSIPKSPLRSGVE